MYPIHSGPSTRSSVLRFVNYTERKVNVAWIDYNGFVVNYDTLKPNCHCDIDAYQGHLWFATDVSVGTRMLLNNKRVFYPSAGDRENADPGSDLRNSRPNLINQWGQHNVNDDLHQSTREIVCITIPVLSLLQRSAEVINTSLGRSKNYHALDIPKELKYLLYEYQYVRHFNIPP